MGCHVMQLAGAEAGKPACMALLSAFEAGRQPRLAMQVCSPSYLYRVL